MFFGYNKKFSLNVTQIKVFLWKFNVYQNLQVLLMINKTVEKIKVVKKSNRSIYVGLFRWHQHWKQCKSTKAAYLKQAL